MSSVNLYRQLAVLFTYPAVDYRLHADECLRLFETAPTDASTAFHEFLAGIAGLSTEESQELFTRTFDLNPVCTLEIGWQLFGEDYHRGEFLVKMRQQLREYGLQESGELPDHMSHALMLLGELDGEEAGEFVATHVLPAIDKMRNEWKQNRNAFASLVDATFALLKSEYRYDPARTPAHVPELHILQ